MRLHSSWFLSMLLTPFALAQAPDGSDVPTPASDPRVMLGFQQFDPVVAVPQVPFALQADQSCRLFIVQFWSTPTDADRAAVRAMGGEIRGYLPHDCHLVLATRGAEALFGLPAVRWVGPYHAAYRLEPLLVREHLVGAAVPVRDYNLVMADKRRDKAVLAQKIVGVGGEVVNPHEGGLLFTARLTFAQMLQVAKFDEVLWIDRWTPPEHDMDNARIQGGANAIETAGGYTGSGVRGHIHEGVEPNHPDFNTAMTQVGPAACTGADDHGHCTAGIVFGNGTSAPQARGMAPDAVGFYTNYLSPGNTTCATSPSRNSILSTAINTHNCMFTTASWGNAVTTAYTSDSADADDLVFDLRIPWTQSQSNTGNQDSRPQAWAKNVISVGGFDHFNNATAADDSWLDGNGSIGPAADGRAKPDVSAYYESVWTSDLSGAAGYSSGNSTTTFGGTSAATPIVAGMNALAIQMYTDHIFNNPARVVGGTRFQNRPYAQTLKALQIACANMLTPTATNNRREHVGWGMPDLENMYTRRHRLTIVPEDAPIAQGQTHTYQVEVLPGETLLKVCMTYLDPAANPAAFFDRVNDLTLRVTSPGGTNYFGNVGLVGASQTNQSTSGGSANTLDTVEMVVRNNPSAGFWTITITAPTVVQDAHVATGATDAVYALVVNGGRRVYGSGCAQYIPDISATDSSGNYYPFGGYSPAQLTSTFASNNGGAVGGTVFFDLTVTNPIWVHGFHVNTATASGTRIYADIWLTAAGGTHVGNELNPGAWNPTTAALGFSGGTDASSELSLSKPFRLSAGTYGVAIVANNFSHRYTSGANVYSNGDVQIDAGSATNGAFSGTVNSPRTANVTLNHRAATEPAQNMRYQTIVRRAQLGAAGTINDLSFSALSSGRHYNSNLQVRMSHVPAGHVMSTNFATNLPSPVVVMNANEYSFEYASGVWRLLGLQTPFAYNGTSDVVIDIQARGNVQTSTGAGIGTFHRSPIQERVFASFDLLMPPTGTYDDGFGLRMRVGFNCAGANEHGSACGALDAYHTGDGRRGSNFGFRVQNIPAGQPIVCALGLDNAFPLPTSLTPYGWTNCTAFINATVFEGVSPVGGFGHFPLAIPDVPSLDGATVFGQWFGFDPNEPGGVTFSNSTRLIIGVAP